jgi:hypothetical protein
VTDDSTVTITAYDSLLNPTTVSKELHSARFSYTLDRSIKVFELGTFAFLMDDLFSGLKLPNYITDFNRSQKIWKIDFALIEGIDGDNQGELQVAANNLAFFFDVTCGKYRYNKLKAGAINVDYADVTNTGAGEVYGRIKNFTYSADMLEYGKIECSVEYWQGYIIRIMN